MTHMISRAKNKDTGWWVEGYYACESNHACFGNELKYSHFIFKDEFLDWGIGGLVQYEVDPKTVGRFTGLHDKNGKMIFEGDIVRCQERFDRPYSDKRKSKRHIGVVEYLIRAGDRFYNPETDKWDRRVEYSAEWIVKVEDYGKFVHGSWGDFFDCEVIGNIHDNPELLKVGEHDA